jgi:predicted transcriptional regulator
MHNEVRRSGSELEHDVLTALATAGGQPMTVEQVRERIDGAVMCTTVMKVLGRLHAQGLTRRDRVGHAYVYTPLCTRAQQTAGQMRHLLDSGDDRAAILDRFVGLLAPEEERLLAELIAARAPRVTPRAA